MKRWAIRCTPPGDLLRKYGGLSVIYFNTYAEAEAEAQRITQAAHNNLRLAGAMIAYTPVEAEAPGEH